MSQTDLSAPYKISDNKTMFVAFISVFSRLEFRFKIIYFNKSIIINNNYYPFGMSRSSPK